MIILIFIKYLITNKNNLLLQNYNNKMERHPFIEISCKYPFTDFLSELRLSMISHYEGGKILNIINEYVSDKSNRKKFFKNVRNIAIQNPKEQGLSIDYHNYDNICSKDESDFWYDNAPLIFIDIFLAAIEENDPDLDMYFSVFDYNEYLSIIDDKIKIIIYHASDYGTINFDFEEICQAVNDFEEFFPNLVVKTKLGKS